LPQELLKQTFATNASKRSDTPKNIVMKVLQTYLEQFI
jgi:hypothetical protein